MSLQYLMFFGNRALAEFDRAFCLGQGVHNTQVSIFNELFKKLARNTLACADRNPVPFIHMPPRNNARVHAPQHLGFFRVGLQIHNRVADAVRVHSKNFAANAVYRITWAERLIGGRQRHSKRNLINNLMEVFGGYFVRIRCTHTFESNGCYTVVKGFKVWENQNQAAWAVHICRTSKTRKEYTRKICGKNRVRIQRITVE